MRRRTTRALRPTTLPQADRSPRERRTGFAINWAAATGVSESAQNLQRALAAARPVPPSLMRSSPAADLGSRIAASVVGNWTQKVLAPFQAQMAQAIAAYLPMQDYLIHLNTMFTPVTQAYREQFRAFFKLAGPLFAKILPENWPDIEDLDFALIETIVLDEGIPLVAVPRPAIVQRLLDAPDERARRAILGRRCQAITDDCEQCLQSLTCTETQNFVGYAAKVASALRG